MNLYQAFTNIADAIRAKTGWTNQFTPLEMPGAISNISTGVDPNDYKIFVNEGSGYVESEALKASVGSEWNTSFRTAFNYPILIGNSVTSCGNMFLDASNFNQPVTIPDSVTNCYGMFNRALKFNQPVTIPNRVTNCVSMFTGALNFNQPVVIGNSVTSCAYMFSTTRNFNQPVTIPDSVTNCAYMFYNDSSFNQPVTIGNNVINCFAMFQNALTFNQPVTIPNGVTNCYNMFWNDSKFNQPVIISNSVTSCAYMFWNCKNMTSNIYIRQQNSYVDVKSMLMLKDNSKQINLFCNNISILNKTSSNNSLVGSYITWSAITNGYYNATFNIYIYNNCPY